MLLTVHPKTPPPVSPGSEQPPEDRSHGRPNCPHDGRDSKIEPAVPHRKRVADDHVDQYAHAARPDPLDTAAGDESIHPGRERAQQAAGEEEGLRDEHDGLAAPDVGDGAPHGGHGRAPQDEGPAHPDVARRGLELGGDGRYRRRDHGQVQRREQDGQAEGRHDQRGRHPGRLAGEEHLLLRPCCPGWFAVGGIVLTLVAATDAVGDVLRMALLVRVQDAGCRCSFDNRCDR